MPQFPASYVDRPGHRIFESQNLGIGLGLSVVFPSYLQTKILVQTPVLPPVDECDDLQMLTSVFNSVFGEIL